MFERPHHQRIAQILLALNGPLLQRIRALRRVLPCIKLANTRTID